MLGNATLLTSHLDVCGGRAVSGALGRPAAGPETSWRTEADAMGCLLVIVGLITPRFVLFVLWVFTDYLSRAYGTWFWPTIGFFFMPTTTLGYAIAQNAFHGVQGWGLVLVILGVLLDLGLLGGGARNRRRRS